MEIVHLLFMPVGVLMTQLHSFLLILHIVLGCTALILFWVPFYTQKGQLNHKKFGTYYKNVMYGVAASGAVMAIMVLLMPLVIKHHFAQADNPEQIANSIRSFWIFLLYLSLLSFTSTRHGYAVLLAKDNRTQLRTWNYALPLLLLFIGGVALTTLGAMRSSTLHIAFGVLGTFVGFGSLRYVFAEKMPKKRYILEHIGGMMGSGIGAYTAFLAFGGRHLFDAAGSYQIIFWIAPGVVGSFASYMLCKKYGKVFRVA
jgi:hypothetical protein